MTRFPSLPPVGQLAPLLEAYNQAVAGKRRQLLLGLALATIALAISAIGAEVQPVLLWNKIGNFTSYFDRLLKLDTGMRVWTDPKDVADRLYRDVDRRHWRLCLRRARES